MSKVHISEQTIFISCNPSSSSRQRKLQSIMIPAAFRGFGVRPQVPRRETKMTTLPNGVKIVSEARPKPEATVGLFIDCGSVFETPNSFGVSSLLELMAFHPPTEPSHQQMLDILIELQAIGADFTPLASEELMGYVIDGLKTHVEMMVEILVDCVMNPAFIDEHVNANLLRLKAKRNEASNDPEKVIKEAILSTAYSGALANPLLPRESAINRLNSKILRDFVAENYTAPRIVLTGVGVDHEYLVSIAEPLLSDLPAVPRPEAPISVYIGGDYRCQAGFGITHFALAFEAPGCRLNRKEYDCLAILQVLMGGYRSVSGCTGTGGTCTRLCSRAHKDPQLEHCHAIASLYNKTSLFGIRVTTRSGFASKAVDIVVKELIDVATPGNVKQAGFVRFKEAYMFAIPTYTESSREYASEGIARDVLRSARISVEDTMKGINELTVDDMVSVSRKLLASPLTMVSYGDVRKIPKYEQVASKFRSI